MPGRILPHHSSTPGAGDQKAEAAANPAEDPRASTAHRPTTHNNHKKPERSGTHNTAEELPKPSRIRAILSAFLDLPRSALILSQKSL